VKKIRANDDGFILPVLFTINLLGELDYQIIPPLLPLLATTFVIEPSVAGRIVPVYAISAGLSSLCFGYLSDQYGRRPFIKFGLLGFSTGTLLTSVAHSLEWLFLARFLTGAAAGGLMTCATSYAADFFHYRHRGRAMGLLSASYFAAAIIGIPVVTSTASKVGWQPVFLVTAVISLSLAPFVWQLLRPRDQFGLQAGAVAESAVFSRIVRISATIIRRRETCAILLVSLFTSGAVVGFITYLGSHLNRELHVPIQQVGLIFFWSGLASLIGAPVAGILADRFGKRVMLIISGLILAPCLAMIPALSVGLGLLICLALAGLTIAFRMAPLLSIATELVSSRERGTLLALRNASSQLGIAISTFISSYCYLYGGYQAVGFFASSQALVSTLLTWCLIREPKPEGQAVKIPQGE
jgi:predicted MFS family arabinose efflux permease